MKKHQWLFALLVLSLSALSCNYVTRMLNPVEEAPTSAAPTEAPVTLPPASPPPASETQDIASLLQSLGGIPCEEQPDLTCVSIPVPLNHFDTADTRSIQVTFAVLPASGERYGMFFQAFPGGPGGEGISSAYYDYFDETVLEHYDIVYYDQRGLGLSSPLECPQAQAQSTLDSFSADDTAGQEGLDTPEEQQQAMQDSQDFVNACLAELNLSNPTDLAFYGTDQVAEDLETFRQTIGDEKIWLYGISYGTAVAQTYAAAHPQNLAGLILDGTVDLTLSGEDGAYSQERGFETVLLATLQACNEDPDCAQATGGDALAAYDSLAQKLSEAALPYQYPLPSGVKQSNLFTFNQLEFTTAYQMYSMGSRMLFLRALSAAHNGDLVPLARLFFMQATIDPATGEYQGDPTFSDTMFTSVHCTDNAYFSGTPQERAAQTIQAGQASNGIVPRLDGGVYSGLTCAFWPSSPQTPPNIAPLTLPGVPTFVLNATLDPATPFNEGKAVFERLQNGYHIYVEGGVHGIYGWGESCPDDYITDFLVSGALPAERETVCQWDPAVTYFFLPLMSPQASDYQNPSEIFFAITDELIRMPEYYYSDFSEEEAFACPYGGSFTFAPSDTGESYRFENCSFTQGFAMTGTGGYEDKTSLISFDAALSGDKTGSLLFTYSWDDGSYSLTGIYGGETYNE